MSVVEILKKAIDTYGINAQLDMCVEEMSELTKEICKHKRGANNRDSIIEEIADVSIMIEQLKLMFNINDFEMHDVIDGKVNRLNKRLREKVK